MASAPLSSQNETPHLKWTLGEILNWTTARFKHLDYETPLLDAQLLLLTALGWEDRIQLYLQSDRPLTGSERDAIRALVKRRLSGEPVAHITGVKYWHNLKLKISNYVLIPRPETETLLDIILQDIQEQKQKPRFILDLCTGSGCLAVALGKEFPDARVVGVDISPEAVAIATENATINGTSNVFFMCANALSQATYSFLLNQNGAADVITANPPYVGDNEWNQLSPDVRTFEPELALKGGATGTEFTAELLEKIFCAEILRTSGGLLACEVGEGHPVALSLPHKLGEMKLNNKITSSSKIRTSNEFYSLPDLEGRQRFLMLRTL